MKRMSKPRKPSKTDKSPWWDKPEQLAALYEYCKQDVRAEWEIHAAIKRLTNSETKVYHYDQKVNLRGVGIDIQFVKAAIAIWDKYCDSLLVELAQITEGRVTSVSGPSMANYLASIGCDMPNIQKGTVVQYLKGDVSGVARRVLEIRQCLGLSSIAKYKKMLQCIDTDGRIRRCMQYHGAQTGRWAGRLIQIQNLPRGKMPVHLIDLAIKYVMDGDIKTIEGLFRSLGDVLSSLIRSAIIADPGKKLIVADFAAIEARGLAWAAEEKWLLNTFANGGDVYIAMAADIYDKNPDDISKEERYFGKTAVLGCGYQMGGVKFHSWLSQNDVAVDKSFAQMVVDKYRDKNKRIKRLWWRMGSAALECLKDGKSTEVGYARFEKEEKWLRMKLPSGRYVSYYNPTITEGKFGEQMTYIGTDLAGNPCPVNTYGGKLVENFIQAICRDILIEACNRLEKHGYPVVAHVHDEVIIEVDEDFGSFEEVERIMCETPRWAKGFPIAAEGFETRRYKK